MPDSSESHLSERKAIDLNCCYYLLGCHPFLFLCFVHPQILERWISKTVEARELTCSNLLEDLKDGWLLFNLCEVHCINSSWCHFFVFLISSFLQTMQKVLSGLELKSFGKWSKGKMRIQTVANMTIVFKYLKSIDIKLGNIGKNPRCHPLSSKKKKIHEIPYCFFPTTTHTL